MKLFLIIAASLLIPGISTPGAFAQSSPAQPPAHEPPAAKKQANDDPEKRAARDLLEEARTYVDRKFAEFNKQKLPFDQKLEARTKQEQKDLAAEYASVLQARKSLVHADLYYLGMLHHVRSEEHTS